jgi:diguanylate cyclase (GGDEF)-like protein/PAS domain S-box-containing protein
MSSSINFADPDAVRQPISSVMSHPVVSLAQTTPVSEAALRFNAERRRHFLVVDDAGSPVGILSQTDVALNQGLEPYLRLREVQAAMRQRVLVLEGQLLLAQAARSMRLSECDAVVVRCINGELGILTERDLVRFVARHPGNTPIDGLASRPLLTVHQHDTLISARDLLMNHRVRHLAVLDDAGEVVGLLGFRDMLAGAEQLYLQDLREALEQRDRALAKSRENLQLAERVIESSLEGVIITDPANRIEFVNRAFTHMTGYTAEEVIGKTPEVLSSGRHDAAFYRQMWDALKRSGYWRGEIWNRRKSGELYLEMLTITAITDDSGAVTHYAAQFSDITNLREKEERIRKLAYYDALTGLPNRRLVEDRLSLAIRHAHRNQTRLAVIFVDLDHFKEVNDALGHAFGDELLVMVAERLQMHLREDDTLARLGGDEFLVLLPDLEEIDEVTRIARRLVAAVAEPCVIEGQEFNIGCSLGISLYPDDTTTAESLVHNADIAMYRAKQEGRNGYRLFRNEMNLLDDRQRALEKPCEKRFARGRACSCTTSRYSSERAAGCMVPRRWFAGIIRCSATCRRRTSSAWPSERRCCRSSMSSCWNRSVRSWPPGVPRAQGRCQSASIFPRGSSGSTTFRCEWPPSSRSTAWRLACWGSRLPSAPCWTSLTRRAWCSSACGDLAARWPSTISAPAMRRSATCRSCRSTCSRSTGVSSSAWTAASGAALPSSRRWPRLPGRWGCAWPPSASKPTPSARSSAGTGSICSRAT